LLGLLISQQVDAAQLISGADTQRVQVDVSASETNRLSIAGRRITSVVPAQRGLISVQKDEAQGTLYFTMSGVRPDGPMTLFVSDDQSTTYTLILVPRPISGEDISVQPPADKIAAVKHDARAASYQRGIKNLILLMAGDGAGSVPVGKEIPLWQEGTLLFVAKFPGNDIVGEKYRLTNTSPTDLLLVEQELYRRGVLAVSVKNQTLAPGDSTDIFVVREARHE